MQVTFLPAAEKEMLKSVAYYEQRDQGLGAKLLDEIEDILDLISKHPGKSNTDSTKND